MNNLKFILISLMAAGLVYSKDKVVYGEDNRLDVFEVQSLFWRSASDSTAAMIPKDKLVVKDGMISIESGSLGSELNLCPGEKFADQKNPAFCSGFLFGGRLLITAGHCATQKFCDSQDWVFGMYQNKDNNDLEVPIENIYSCKQIIAKTQNSHSMEDWGIIELDRKVKGVARVEIRLEGEIEVGEKLVVIGHPSGLPTKVADGAFVRKNDNPNFFQANLDTFGGNSGSAVFNAHTGLVEGILVRGENDYESDTVDEKNCMRVKKCAMDECRGEDVQKIPPILKYLRTGDY
jgi:V8-like Glu-specific endopeptidase